MKNILHQVYFQNSVRDWIIAAAMVILVFAVVGIAGSGIIKKLKRLASRTSTVYDDIILLAVEKFIFPFLYIGAFYVALSYLSLPPTLQR